jgi:hypothetical protein
MMERLEWLVNGWMEEGCRNSRLRFRRWQNMAISQLHHMSLASDYPLSEGGENRAPHYKHSIWFEEYYSFVNKTQGSSTFLYKLTCDAPHGQMLL